MSGEYLAMRRRQMLDQKELERILRQTEDPAPTSVPQAEPRLPWTDEQLGEYIWTQIDEQGANGNICKPLGICDERFDRVFAEVVKARAPQAEPPTLRELIDKSLKENPRSGLFAAQAEPKGETK